MHLQFDEYNDSNNNADSGYEMLQTAYSQTPLYQPQPPPCLPPGEQSFLNCHDLCCCAMHVCYCYEKLPRQKDFKQTSWGMRVRQYTWSGVHLHFVWYTHPKMSIRVRFKPVNLLSWRPLGVYRRTLKPFWRLFEVDFKSKALASDTPPVLGCTSDNLILLHNWILWIVLFYVWYDNKDTCIVVPQLVSIIPRLRCKTTWWTNFARCQTIGFHFLELGLVSLNQSLDSQLQRKQ